MDDEGVEAVVDLEARLDAHQECDDACREQSHAECTNRIDRIGRRSDADEAGDRAGDDAQRCHVAFTNLLDDGEADHASATGQQRVEDDELGQEGRAQGTAAVETEPAEPQDAATEKNHRHVVWALHALAARAEHKCERKSCDTRIHVHRGAAREIVDADLVQQEAALGVVGVCAEYPVGDREVDERQPDGNKDQPRRELHTTGRATGHDRHGDRREQDEPRCVIENLGSPGAVIGLEVQEPDVVGWIADQPPSVDRRARNQSIPVHDVEHAGDAEGDQHHRHHVEHIARPEHASVIEGEPGKHEQNEHECGKHPRQIRMGGKLFHGRSSGWVISTSSISEGLGSISGVGDLDKLDQRRVGSISGLVISTSSISGLGRSAKGWVDQRVRRVGGDMRRRRRGSRGSPCTRRCARRGSR